MKNIVKISALGSLALPLIASAQLGGVKDLLFQFDQVIKFSLGLLVGLALLVFFWGLVKFIFAQGSETVKVEAKKVMLWGVIALFVMVSVWGLVNFMQEAFFGSSNFSNPDIPGFNN